MMFCFAGWALNVQALTVERLPARRPQVSLGSAPLVSPQPARPALAPDPRSLRHSGLRSHASADSGYGSAALLL